MLLAVKHSSRPTLAIMTAMMIKIIDVGFIVRSPYSAVL
jgi:hypothetical protein